MGDKNKNPNFFSTSQQKPAQFFWDPRFRQSSSSLEQTFRFLHLRRSYGKEFIKKEFESLDYDPCENEVYLNTKRQQNFSAVAINALRRFINFALVGVITGCIGSFVNYSILRLSNFKNKHLSSVIEACLEGQCLFKVFGTWCGFIGLYVLVAFVSVTFFEPAGIGGGISGISAYLNGVDVPRYLTCSVIFFKTISMIFVCASGIVGGKEGPMIHIGAAVGGVIVLIPGLCNLCQPFRNHPEMRDFIAAGVTSGVSAAFGAPVGGFLLSVEESVSFLSVSLLFKLYVTALFSVATVKLISSYYHGIGGNIEDEELLYIGLFDESISNYTINEFPAFILIGVVAGLVGSFYVCIQKSLHVYRRRHLAEKWKKCVEATLLVILVGSIHMGLTYSCNECNDYDNKGNAVKLKCAEGVNEISMYTLQSGEETLKWLIYAKEGTISLTTALTLFVAYFFMGAVGLGCSMAIGVFVPNLLIGALWGRCISIMFNSMFPNNAWANPSKYTFLACAAQLSGSLRLTFSISAIMMECTGSNNLVVPLMISLITAKWVGDLLTPPMFQAQVVLSGMPYLFPQPPSFACEIPVKAIMSKPVVTFSPVVTVGELITALKTYTFQGYPVIDKNNTLMGLVLTSQILILLKYKIFLGADVDLDELGYIFSKEFRKVIKVSDLQLKDRDFVQRVNLHIVMNPSPYAVRQNMSFDRAYQLFRCVGLRHLIVVDNKYQVVGIISRKDLAKYLEVQDGIAKLPIV